MTKYDVILAQTDITYRQLDYWVRQGWLNPHHNGGSGTSRDFTGDEYTVAIRMARLVNRGFTPAAAARVARASVEAASGYVYLGQGLHLHIHDEGDR